ncbi:MAG: hypothetical protein ACD_46C00039G0001 [uncultured bacterium]|nr:MAG: hypothetical protein ACD_46C00039G0001 [uncultured bacterium]
MWSMSTKPNIQQAESLTGVLADAKYVTLAKKGLVFSDDQLRDLRNPREVCEYILDEFKSQQRAEINPESVYFIFDLNQQTFLFKFDEQCIKPKALGLMNGDSGLEVLLNNYENNIQWFFTPTGLCSPHQFIQRIIKNEKGEDEDPAVRFNIISIPQRNQNP